MAAFPPLGRSRGFGEVARVGVHPGHHAVIVVICHTPSGVLADVDFGPDAAVRGSAVRVPSTNPAKTAADLLGLLRILVQDPRH